MKKLLPLLLILAGVLVYQNSLSGPFIYDDVHSVEGNPSIRQIMPISSWFSAPSQSPVAGRPIVNLSLSINYALGAMEVEGYHAVNLAIHILCGLTLFGIIRRTLRLNDSGEELRQEADMLAAACTLLWLVHPLQSECVNYITQRTESIMALFYLLTLYSAIRGLRSARRQWWHGAAILSCCLGMASKESMVTAPVMVLLYDWVFVRTGSTTDLLKRRWKLYTGLAAAWLVLLALVWSGPRSETVGFAAGVTAWQYAANQSVLILQYFRLVLWPHPLILDYGWGETLTLTQVIPQVLLLGGLLAGFGLLFLYHRKMGFLGFWALLILAPTSSLVPIASEVGAERRMYLPLAGLITLIVISAYFFLKRRRFPKWVGALLILTTATMLGWGTVRRNRDYRTRESIWRTVVERNPANPRGYVNLGAALDKEGSVDEAVALLRRALEMKEDYPDAHFNLANALDSGGLVEDAISHYRRALEIKPNHPEALSNLGLVLGARGNVEEEIRHYREALRLRPDYLLARTNLARALQSQGNLGEAIEQYREILRLQPDDAVALLNLGSAYGAQGSLGEAIRCFRLALELETEHPQIHYNLANAWAARGGFEEAVLHYRRTLQLDPGHADAHENLALVLQMRGDVAVALGHYQAALRIAPDRIASLHGLAWILAVHPDPSVRDPAAAVGLAERATALTNRRDPTILSTLAAAYSSAGQVRLALSTAQESLALARAAQDPGLVEQIQQQIEQLQKR